MTERQRLIELLKKGQAEYSERSLAEVQKILYEKHRYNSATDKVGNLWDELADYLLENGVIVPPCKVGDTVYRIWSVGNYGKGIADFVVTKVAQITERSWVVGYQKRAKTLYATPTRYQCNFEDFGKTVFLTKEEAEKALAERRKEDEGK